MKVKICLLFLLTISIILPKAGFALDKTSTNFIISPPPVPWFEFRKEQVDLRLGGSFLSVSAEESEKGANDEIGIACMGINSAARYAFTDYLAVDAGINASGGREYKNNNLDIILFMLSVPVDLELQAFKSDRVSIILFGGFAYMGSYVYIGFWEGIPHQSFYSKYNIWASIYGPQAGIQAGISAGDFTFTPYFMFQRVTGSIDLDFYRGGELQNSANEKLKDFNILSFGLDIIYRPWKITLSSIFQQITAAKGNRDVQTIIIALSYDFQWGGREEKGVY
jgi:hypothetical protein